MFYELIDDTPSEVDGAPNEAQKTKKRSQKGAKRGKTFVPHCWYKEYGASKQGRIVNLKTGDPCPVFTFLDEIPFVEVKDVDGKVCSMRVKQFVWECWNGKRPSDCYIFPINKDIKNAHLGNLKLFTVEEIDKKDYWDFVL